MAESEIPTTGRLELDAATFRSRFDRRPFVFGHALAGHPLFTLPRLVALAGRLAPGGADGAGGSILYFRADHAIDQAAPAYGAAAPGARPGRTFVTSNLARPDLPPERVVEQIESANAWMQLRGVGADPEYGALVRALLEEFRPYAEPLAPGISGLRADIFVSSPGATTPFHLDEEHNFLLQIRGTKRMSIADGSNRSVLGESDLEDFYRGAGELAHYTPRLEEFSEQVDLAPGRGVHIPPCHPHWVKNGDAVSISLGILWHSDCTARRRQLYSVKRWLRRLGLHPAPVGASPRLDTLKSLPFQLKRRALRGLQRVVRGPR
jgi:hypothetical protein